MFSGSLLPTCCYPYVHTGVCPSYQPAASYTQYSYQQSRAAASTVPPYCYTGMTVPSSCSWSCCSQLTAGSAESSASWRPQLPCRELSSNNCHWYSMASSFKTAIPTIKHLPNTSTQQLSKNEIGRYTMKAVIVNQAQILSLIFPTVEITRPAYRSQDNKRQPRKDRLNFTAYQINELEAFFARKKYISIEERQQLAQSLGVSEQQVKTWYQNRRSKWKRSPKITVSIPPSHHLYPLQATPLQ